LDEGWCNQCGKAIPQWEISAGLKERRQHRHHEPRSAAPPPVAEPEPEPEPAPPRPVPQARPALAAPVRPRSWPITALGVANIILGGLALAWGVYLLVASVAISEALIRAGDDAGGVMRETNRGMAAVIGTLVLVASVCSLAEGLPLLLAGFGVLTRRTWGRVLALVLAVLLGLEGLACLSGTGRHAGLLGAGLALLAYAALTFVVLLRGQAAVEFGRPVR
jgi:hypothetical protein